jgi:endonuclease/exonuclease/phosphatase family metal-dependent hydrolase
MSVRIVTYNLLVPIFAEEPGYFIKCRRKYLRTEYRWKLIQSQLEQEIRFHKNTIICLQEVSQTLLPKLKSFFHRMNYTLFDSLYGEQFNDYMGVALAVPISIQLISKNSIKIGDYLRSNIQSFEKDSTLFAWWNNVKDLAMGHVKKPATDPWEIAMSKSNTLICLGVVIDGRPLFIGTYHMPALFKILDVMVIHSSAVKDLMFQLTGGHSFILAGDFNFKPYDIPYRVITERGYAQNILLPKVGPYDVSYRFNTQKILRSAYREKNGSEPNYTNFSTTKKSPNFCATLDYIFFAGNLVVDDVLKLPNHPTGKSYPDKTHPSDHLMLAASFRLF